MTDYWELYTKSQKTDNALEKFSILTECAGQTEDTLTQRIALHDVGYMLYTGNDVPRDKARGKEFMKLSADLGHSPAMNLYGQMLTHDGDLSGSIIYFCRALHECEFIAAKNLNEIYAVCHKSGNKEACNFIESEIAKVIDGNMELIKNNDDNKGIPQLSLAIICLYELGFVRNMSSEDGEEYLKTAIDKGNYLAKRIQANPELKHPSTISSFNPYKNNSNDKSESNNETLDEKKDLSFGLSDIIIALILGGIAGLIINLIFHVGFIIPFLITSIIVTIILFMGSE